MALDGISNLTNYQDYSKTTQQVSSGSAIPNSTGSTITNSTAEPMQSSNVLVDQQKNMNLNQQKDDTQSTADRIKNALNDANDKIKYVRTGCEFSYNDEINRISIKVYNKDTKEVIREIPPEETQKMLEKMWDIAGLLVDEKR